MVGVSDNHSDFTGRMPFLPPNQQRQSTEGKSLWNYQRKNIKGQPAANPKVYLETGRYLYLLTSLYNINCCRSLDRAFGTVFPHMSVHLICSWTLSAAN